MKTKWTEDVLDVTDLYYQSRTLERETKALHDQVAKLETEIDRMRRHVEQEPQRIAEAVQAAKVNIENKIEPVGSR